MREITKRTIEYFSSDKHAISRCLQSRIGLEPLYHDFLSALSQVDVGKSRVLELGCGVGGFTDYISKYEDIEAFGLDVNKSLLVSARRLSGENANFICASAETLPFRLSVFDAVISVELLHHLAMSTWNLSKKRISTTLSEAIASAKSGGFFFFLETCLELKLQSFLYYWISDILDRLGINVPFLQNRGLIVSFLTKKEFEDFLRRLGIRVAYRSASHTSWLYGQTVRIVGRKLAFDKRFTKLRNVRSTDRSVYNRETT